MIILEEVITLYEFTKKELRKEFKKTEYGKKVNIWLYISLVINIFIYILDILFFFIFLDSENITTLFPVMITISFISSVICCYFDGKRDGAIEQFKRDYRKNKE